MYWTILDHRTLPLIFVLVALGCFSCVRARPRAPRRAAPCSAPRSGSAEFDPLPCRAGRQCLDKRHGMWGPYCTPPPKKKWLPCGNLVIGYWTWPIEIVDLPKNMVIFHSKLLVYQRVSNKMPLITELRWHEMMNGWRNCGGFLRMVWLILAGLDPNSSLGA